MRTAPLIAFCQLASMLCKLLYSKRGRPAADAAKAFRELRVRPSLGSGGGLGRAEAATAAAAAAGAGTGVAAAHTAAHQPERPSSPPKKRKASHSVDKEFILKDDKVKRNAGGWGGWAQDSGESRWDDELG